MLAQLAAFQIFSLHFRKLPWCNKAEFSRQIWSSGGSSETYFAVQQLPGALSASGSATRGRAYWHGRACSACACSQASAWVDKTEFARNTSARMTTTKILLGFLPFPFKHIPMASPNTASLACHIFMQLHLPSSWP